MLFCGCVVTRTAVSSGVICTAVVTSPSRACAVWKQRGVVVYHNHLSEQMSEAKEKGQQNGGASSNQNGVQPTGNRAIYYIL